MNNMNTNPKPSKTTTDNNLQSDPALESEEQFAQKLSELTLNESEKQSSESAEESKQEQHHEEQEEYFTRDLIEISKPSINFTKAVMFPGSIDEVEVAISLKEDVLPDEDPRAAYLLRSVALCHNSEFNDLDEYVFSVRSNERFQYFEEVRFKLRKKQRALVKVAVKVPPITQSQVIEGTLSIQLESTVPLFLQINAKCEIPKIICLKDLFDTKQKTNIIKIPAKKNMRMPPIPFKNMSLFNFIVEIECLTIEDMSKRPYDILSQNTVNCMPNTPFFVNMQLKTNMNYKGTVPKTDTVRKILILKVKNSSVHYSYPIQAYIYESSVNTSMS